MTIMHSTTERPSRSFPKPSLTRHFFPEHLRTWLRMTWDRAFSTGCAMNSVMSIFSRSPYFRKPSNPAFKCQLPEALSSNGRPGPLICTLLRFSCCAMPYEAGSQLSNIFFQYKGGHHVEWSTPS